MGRFILRVEVNQLNQSETYQLPLVMYCMFVVYFKYEHNSADLLGSHVTKAYIWSRPIKELGDWWQKSVQKAAMVRAKGVGTARQIDHMQVLTYVHSEETADAETLRTHTTQGQTRGIDP